MLNKNGLKLSTTIILLMTALSVLFLSPGRRTIITTPFIGNFILFPCSWRLFGLDYEAPCWPLAVSRAFTYFSLVNLVWVVGRKNQDPYRNHLLERSGSGPGTLRESEKKEHRRIQKMENLATIGKTVSGIAHDMKIPLVAIAGFARRILKKMDGDNPHREQLTIIFQEAQRLENMVKDMLDYARPLNLRLSRENVNQAIEESIVVVKGTAESKQVTIVSRLFPDIVAVEFDPSRMKQVFINLLTNAVQASPAGETVCVRSSVDGGKIVIDVTDHGHGLTAEQKENIFTPFFTTKKEGIGLGLIMVKNIVWPMAGRCSFLTILLRHLVSPFELFYPKMSELSPHRYRSKENHASSHFNRSRNNLRPLAGGPVRLPPVPGAGDGGVYPHRDSGRTSSAGVGQGHSRSGNAGGDRGYFIALHDWGGIFLRQPPPDQAVGAGGRPLSRWRPPVWPGCFWPCSSARAWVRPCSSAFFCP